MKLDRTTYEAWLLDRIEGALSPEQERELDVFLAANPDLRSGQGELPTLGAGAERFDAKDLLKKTFPPTGEPDLQRLNDFLVARVEGDLSPLQEKQLDRLLYEHPHLERDAKLMAAGKVKAEWILFIGRPGIERQFPPQGLPDKYRLTDFLIAAAEGDLSMEQRAALEHHLLDDPQGRREQRVVAAARILPEQVVFSHKESLKKRDAKVIALWPRLAAAASVALLVGLAWWFMHDRTGSTDEYAADHITPVVAPEQRPVDVQRLQGNDTGAVQLEVPGSMSDDGHSKEIVPGTPGNNKGGNTLTPSASGRPATRRVEAFERMEPSLMAQRASAGTSPVGVNVPTIEWRDDPPTEFAGTVGGHSRDQVFTVGQLIASTVRSEVLDKPEDASRDLDKDDAVAFVDKSLGTMGQGDAGMAVKRDAQGRWKNFQLRLGRGVGISASR